VNDLIFFVFLTCLLAILLAWGFRNLPRECWQMLAVVPLKKREDGQWQAVNLTYYGFFLASGQTSAVCLLLILLGAAHISLVGTLITTAMVLAVCIPSARIIAILVEKKRHTFTIGGASFVGILLAPWSIMLVEKVSNRFFDCYLPMLPVLAAMAIAYTLGEGLGRLGCISFGCCYGKKLKDCGPLMQRLFTRMSFVFQGPTKKAIYEGSLGGEPLIPIQGITCILYCLTAITGSFLFLRGYTIAALILSIAVSQLWRIVSETMRADFRGFAKISAYQKMGGLAVLYMLLIVGLNPTTHQLTVPEIGLGLSLLWQPGIIIGLQILWLLTFTVFGRSTVTTSTVSFQLLQHRL
jgi:prolipoprotein diacylglyceryltransferase